MSQMKHAYLEVDKLKDFLSGHLPRKSLRNLDSILAAVADEAKKFDARIATKHLWSDYGARRRRLKTLSSASVVLSRELIQLDPIAKDLLMARLPPETLEKVKGYLMDVCFAAEELLRKTPQRGRPSNLAEEIWVMAMADIYESAFGRKPSISHARGAFFEFVQAAKPFRMARAGDLDPRSLRRALKKRDVYLERSAQTAAGANSDANWPPQL